MISICIIVIFLFVAIVAIPIAYARFSEANFGETPDMLECLYVSTAITLSVGAVIAIVILAVEVFRFLVG